MWVKQDHVSKAHLGSSYDRSQRQGHLGLGSVESGGQLLFGNIILNTSGKLTDNLQQDPLLEHNSTFHEKIHALEEQKLQKSCM